VLEALLPTLIRLLGLCTQANQLGILITFVYIFYSNYHKKIVVMFAVLHFFFSDKLDLSKVTCSTITIPSLIIPSAITLRVIILRVTALNFIIPSAVMLNVRVP